jgi:hypothetical protein
VFVEHLDHGWLPHSRPCHLRAAIAQIIAVKLAQENERPVNGF